MLTLPLPADSPQVAQLYRMLRALLWLVLLLVLASEWLVGGPVPLLYPAVLIAVVGLWLYFGRYWQRRWRLQLWLDLLLLLAFFAGHGGGTNPLLTILLLPLAAAAATLSFWHWLALVAAAGAGYALLLLGLEPLLPFGHDLMHHTAGHHLPASGHLWGMWASFMLAAGLSGIFINRLARAGGPLQLSLLFEARQLVISVSDQGPGFPAWLLADQPAPTPPQGMGLGVMLVRTAMELCGGRLQLFNLATGGCARLLLPLAYVQRPTGAG